jgi:hypothetical protein
MRPVFFGFVRIFSAARAAGTGSITKPNPYFFSFSDKHPSIHNHGDVLISLSLKSTFLARQL